MRRRARKIRDRIGADYGLGLLASRPKGMHWSTFFRMEEELADLESVVLQAELEETVRNFGLRK
jgi:hypothetical protein